MSELLFLSEAGPNTQLSWLLWIALAFFVLVVFVGWLVSRNGASGSSDDLTRIEGIGPKIAKLLRGAGIDSFADLAKAKPAQVDKVLDQAGLQMMDSAGWVKQAKLAAKGDWEKLAELQGQLKGGRQV
jgi:hypothetical protein